MQHGGVHSPDLLYWRPVYAAWRRTLPYLVVLKTCLCSMAAYTPLPCCIEDLFMQHGGVHSPTLLYWRPVYAAWRRTLPCLVVLKTCLCSMAAYTPLPCCFLTHSRYSYVCVVNLCMSLCVFPFSGLINQQKQYHFFIKFSCRSLSSLFLVYCYISSSALPVLYLRQTHVSGIIEGEVLIKHTSIVWPDELWRRRMPSRIWRLH